MKKRIGFRRFSIVLLLVMLFSLFVGAVQALGDEATVEVFRLDKTFVILKITFPTEISGNFAGVVAGKQFDCITLPPNVLICIGRFREGSDPSFLTIYDKDTEENILQQVISSPRLPGEGDKEPPTPPPSQDDDIFTDDSGPGPS